METEKSHLPFSISFVHRLNRWAGAHKACPLSVDLSPCMRPGTSCEEFTWLRFKDQLGYLTDQLWDRRLLMPMAPKALKEARCCQSLRKLLFPFARAPAKCGKNGPAIHKHWGIRVQQTPKVLRVRSSFGRAGEPTIALKWGGRTNRAQNKALWTH